MKLTKCANGHFYDAEKYQQCPHCQGEGAGGYRNDQAGSMQNAPGASDMDVTQRGPSASGYSGGNEEFATVGFMDMPSAAPVQGNQAAPASVNMNTLSDDDVKTIGYMNWNRETISENSVTRSAGNLQARQNQPVVGWLVCTEGNNYGQSFNLYCGKNFIGRSSKMDISLDDTTVSRERHAILIYEPKQRMFFAQPGDSHELFYRNETVVLSSIELNDRDIITIGKTKLVFVPFCDEKFGWEREL